MAAPISQSCWDQLRLLLIKRYMAMTRANAVKGHNLAMLINKVSEAIFAIAVLVMLMIWANDSKFMLKDEVLARGCFWLNHQPKSHSQFDAAATEICLQTPPL